MPFSLHNFLFRMDNNVLRITISLFACTAFTVLLHELIRETYSKVFKKKMACMII